MITAENGMAAVILAAGLSRRFGNENKLHALTEGDVSVVERVVRLVADFPFKQKIIVAAADDAAMEKLANNYQMRLVTNEQPEQGIGHSISLGASSLDEANLSGVAVFLGDMPYIRNETIAMMIRDFDASNCSQIVRPCCNDRLGNPVFFPCSFLTQLKELHGNVGANSFISQNCAQLLLIPTEDRGVLWDIDVPGDLNPARSASKIGQDRP